MLGEPTYDTWQKKKKKKNSRAVPSAWSPRPKKFTSEIIPDPQRKSRFLSWSLRPFLADLEFFCPLMQGYTDSSLLCSLTRYKYWPGPSCIKIHTVFQWMFSKSYDFSNFLLIFPYKYGRKPLRSQGKAAENRTQS